MPLSNCLDWLLSSAASGRRSRRRLIAAVGFLEDRQLLSGSPTATMTQTATFPNLESYPNAASQAFLYFSSTMGTLTEVDVMTSGSFSTQFSAENLGGSTSAIEETTSANLSINVPSGAIPFSIPAVTESFNASAFDGTLNDGGTSGKEFAPATSSSAPQTTVLTSPAALAAFTGNFRIPVTVSGHATGSATSSDGDLSDAFNTQTSVTITIIYHYTPNLTSLNPPAGGSGSGSGSGAAAGSQSSGTTATNTAQTSPSGTVSPLQTSSTQVQQPAVKGKKKGHAAAKPAHAQPKPKPKPIEHAHAAKKSHVTKK
jgi:hypothetical protein